MHQESIAIEKIVGSSQAPALQGRTRSTGVGGGRRQVQRGHRALLRFLWKGKTGQVSELVIGWFGLF